MTLVVHVPHASTRIPPAIRATFLLDDRDLAAELLAITDRHVDEIVAPLAGLGATIVVHDVSRLVCDPERFPDDRDEPMAAKGMGAVYTHASDGRRLRPATWTDADRARVMAAHYHPHAAAMRDAVAAAIARHGSCLILDAHSFPRAPLPFEDAALERPDICLGTNPGRVPERWLAAWRDGAAARGLTVAENVPFAGAYVPLDFLDDPRVISLMVEYRRDLYMDERTGERIPAGVEALRDLTVQACSRSARDG